MEKKTLKLTAVAAGAVVLAGAAFAAPSFASVKYNSFRAASASSTGTTPAAPTFGAPGARGEHKGAPRFNGVESTLAATITGVPSTVTDVEAAEHAGLFVAYDYTGTAPTTQPTTGGHPAHFEATTLANGTVTGTLGFMTPKTAGTYNVAVYNSKTGTSPVLVTIVVDSAGAATATANGPLTTAYDATLKAPAFDGPAGGPAFGPGFGHGTKGGHGHGDNDGDGPKGGAGWAPSTTATPAPTNG